jgi:hypothetical protein
MQPIFVMSSERSGSNLLRRMLGAHPDVAAPPPPHLWRVLHPLLHHYGPLNEEPGWSALLNDALELTRVPESHLRWRHELSAGEVEPYIRRRNLSGIAGALYEAYAAREDARFWVCKENNLFDHALRIVDVYPEARFVYLVRDGRDVACSIRKVPTHDQHVYFIAREWMQDQIKGIGVYQDLLDSGRALLVRYEDLIGDPQAALREVCGFVELGFEERMLAFHEESESREEAQKTSFWKNLDKPVMAGNKAKFLQELNDAQIALFESVAGGVLEVLGYPLLRAGENRRVGKLRRELYGLVNRFQSRAKMRTLLDEKGRRERQDALRGIRRSREGGETTPLAPRLSYAPESR